MCFLPRKTLRNQWRQITYQQVWKDRHSPQENTREIEGVANESPKTTKNTHEIESVVNESPKKIRMKSRCCQ